MEKPPSNSNGISNKDKWVALLKEVYNIWIAERPAQFAAALAYYAVFSFVPVVYIIFTITDLVVARLSVADWFYTRIADLLGEEIALYVQNGVASLAERTTSGTSLLSAIGFVALFFSASLIFFQVQHVLNTLWKVPPPARGTTRAMVRNRLLASLMVFGVVLLCILSVVLSLVIPIINAYIRLDLPVPLFSYLILVLLSTLSLALIYKLLPNASVAWRDVWLGAAVAALMVMVVIFLVGSYLGASKFSSAMEAAGGMAVLLMGFYTLGQIFVFGAVLTRVYAATFGKGIAPRQE